MSPSSPKGRDARQRRASRPPFCAFTLVEVIVAVAVAAVAMAVAGAAVAGAHTLFARLVASGPAFDSAMERQAALETLRTDLASALPSSRIPFSGDASGFRALCLLAADDGSYAPVVVEWGRSPTGGTARRVTALGGALLSATDHPAAWGPLSLRYRGLADSGAHGDRGDAGDSGPAAVSGSSGAPLALAEPSDRFGSSDPAEPPSLPAMVEVRWCDLDLSLPVPCAAPSVSVSDSVFSPDTRRSASRFRPKAPSNEKNPEST